MDTSREKEDAQETVKLLTVQLRVSELEHVLRMIDMRMTALRSRERVGSLIHTERQKDLNEVVLITKIRMAVQARLDRHYSQTC